MSAAHFHLFIKLQPFFKQTLLFDTFRNSSYIQNIDNNCPRKLDALGPSDVTGLRDVTSRPCM